MTRLEFRNRLCILRSIDRHELVEAGVIDASDDAMWRTFAADPYRWFLLRDDETADKLWLLIERRALPSEINWAVRAEAAKAIAVGLVPKGCSIDASGALVIPDDEAPSGLRGVSLLIAHFDYVVTTTGRIVKDLDGVLKAARAV